MPNAVEMYDVSFSYKGGEKEESIKNIDLIIKEGEVVLLCGPSGCGKTTLTRLINGLIPNYYEGDMKGRVLVLGHEVSILPLYETAKWVGSVFQNPRSQFFNVETSGELAFCLENLGFSEDEIIKRVTRTVNEMHIEPLMNRSMFQLSGGEKQRVACASISVASPDVIVLDEPSSNLDASAIQDLKIQIKQWKNQGKTIIVAEHRLHYLSEFVDRILYMDKGKIIREYTLAELSCMSLKLSNELGLRPIAFKTVFEHEEELSPVRVDTGFRLEGFHFAYPHQAECLYVNDVSFPEQAIVALVGDNGAGKSTLARCLCGLEKRCKGTLYAGEKAYRQKDRLKNLFMVMQDVNHQLFTESVLDEVLLSMPEENVKGVEEILQELNLLELKERHPMSLSGGQKQRVAVACAVASKRRFLILDEPTSGLDLWHMEKVADMLKSFQKKGNTLLIITHDPEFILRCCTHVLRLERGHNVESYALDDVGRQKLFNFFVKTDAKRQGMSIETR